MTRSTTRALALLLLGGAISSGVISAPTSMPSSSPTLNGAQTTPQAPSSCARLSGSLSGGSGSSPGVHPHGRRGLPLWQPGYVPSPVDGSSDGVTSGKNSAERKENAAGGTNNCIPVTDLKDPADDGGRKHLEDIKSWIKDRPPSKGSDEELKDGMMEMIKGYLLDRYKGVSPDVEKEANELYAKLEEEYDSPSRREAREIASRASRGAEGRQDDTTKP
ncbi:hypothetical protein FB446DRAFT_720195 [Lentinula raphanica]|nr:hypothetical protein FB446DRAFT_720195 [Lentinula raphanica]